MPGRDGIEATRDITAARAVRQPGPPSDQRAEQIRRALTGRAQDSFALITAGMSSQRGHFMNVPLFVLSGVVASGRGASAGAPLTMPSTCTRIIRSSCYGNAHRDTGDA
jgi:hypothetical protein